MLAWIMVILSVSVSPAFEGGGKGRGNKGGGGEINGIQRWAELRAMKIAEGAWKDSLMWKTKGHEDGLWPVSCFSPCSD